MSYKNTGYSWDGTYLPATELVNEIGTALGLDVAGWSLVKVQYVDEMSGATFYYLVKPCTDPKQKPNYHWVLDLETQEAGICHMEPGLGPDCPEYSAGPYIGLLQGDRKAIRSAQRWMSKRK
jgi:hypothetical protein